MSAWTARRHGTSTATGRTSGVPTLEHVGQLDNQLVQLSGSVGLQGM